MATQLLAPRNVVLAAMAAFVLTVGGAALERWAGGVDADGLVAAAINVAGLPAERAAAAESMMRPMIANYPVVILLGMVIGWVLLATLAFLVFLAVQAGLSWGAMFAANVYASLAYGGARLVLTGILSLAREPTADEIVQGTFVSTNAAAVLSPDSAPWLLALGRSLDALTLLSLYVFVAVLAASGRSKVSEKTLVAVVGVCYLVWIMIRVGWAMAFGR
jgi:hypothetical protein